MTRIFDNIDDGDRLGPHLIRTFDNHDRLDAAVGYFNLRGWSTFADSIDAKPDTDAPVMRVLVGMTLADHEDQVLASLQAQLEGCDEGAGVDGDTARARKASAILKFRTQLMRGLPTLADQATLRRLKDHLELVASRSNSSRAALFMARPT